MFPDLTRKEMSNKNTKCGFKSWFSDLSHTFAAELRAIFGDMGVMLFFFVLPLCYPIVYTLIYYPQIVTEMPVAVVDNSRTEMSRRLVRSIDASPSVKIYQYCNDMSEAKALFAENKVYGIVEIPSDYERKIQRGEQATVPFYAEMSLLLRYRAFLSALTEVQMKEATEVTSTRLQAIGASSLGIGGLPVQAHNTFIGVPGQGFASFIMPGILILIAQQSIVLGICMLAGTSRDRRRRGLRDPRNIPGASVTATIWGRTFAYTLIYIPMIIYMTRWIPEIFNLPHLGSPVDYLLFVFPLLLASSMFGQTIQGFCSERESAFIVVVFTSVVFLFLSGLTWPRYAMNGFWTWLGNVVPATWGVDGFVRINSNGASLFEVRHAYAALWLLTAVWFIASWWVGARQKKLN